MSPRALGLWFLLLPLTATACHQKPEVTLRVAAAADLAHAFEELRPAFEAETHVPLTVTLGSTGLLSKQILQGAPFDLFAAADTSYVAQVVKAGACDGSTQASYARGRLVVWVLGAGGGALTLTSLRDPRFKHVAIANPEHAPYGAAARAALKKAGVWQDLEERLVFGENVQQTLELAQSGNADAAIVGLSLAIGSKGGSWALIDEQLYPPLEQALVVCGHDKNVAAAKQLAAFMSAPAGRAIMKKYGFLLPGETLAAQP